MAIDMKRVESWKKLRIKINKLTQLAERNQAILLEDLLEEEAALMRIVGKQDLTSVMIGRASQYANFQMFNNERSTKRVDEFVSNTTKAVKIGMEGIGAGMSMDKLPPQMREVYIQMFQSNGMHFVTKMQDSLRADLTKQLQDALLKDIMPNKIANMISERFNVSKARAKTIARTETMRVNNTIAYEQALANGAKFFIVDNREESCEECQAEYEGEVFDINDDNALPPLHPNCACVAVFFDDEEEAQNWVDGIKEDNQEVRDTLVDKGYDIAPDGTGATKK